jgi:hypothetical protein
MSKRTQRKASQFSKGFKDSKKLKNPQPSPGALQSVYMAGWYVGKGTYNKKSELMLEELKESIAAKNAEQS